MSELVDVVREGGLARVVMHRAGNNSIAADLMGELGEAFAALGSDPECRVVVLQSAYDRYFSVGADLGSLGGMDRSAPDAEERIVATMRESNAGFDAIAACPRPVIARLNGHALGGGCELALCCDYRVMVEDGRSRIGQTESALGIIPGAGGTQRLVRLIGRARALPMLYESTRLSAAAAEGGGPGDPGGAAGPARRRGGRAGGPAGARRHAGDRPDQGRGEPGPGPAAGG